MANYVAEWYGFKADDSSPEAAKFARLKECPFVGGVCKKKNGVCSVQISNEIVTVCPLRLYRDNHIFLSEIANEAFGEYATEMDADSQSKLPRLYAGNKVVDRAKMSGKVSVGVFGHGWASEVKLPAAIQGGPRYSVDFTLVCVSQSGELLSFAPVEVQTIDTTGSYSDSVEALRSGRMIISSSFGMNWENVNKRIIPQLIFKGLMLQAERLCHNGIFFVTPGGVYERIIRRLGSESRLRQIPKQPGSITFMRLDQDLESYSPGAPIPLLAVEPRTISTSDMSLAFITPENLPAGGSYEQSLKKRM